MNQQEIQLLTDRQIIDNIIGSKFIIDYGTIIKIDVTGQLVDVQHQVLDTFKGQAIQQPLITYGVELLYLSTGNLVIDSNPQIGDPVLLVGFKRYIAKTSNPMQIPIKSQSEVSYTRSNLKAIPMSAIPNAPSFTLRADGGKLKARNATLSLYKLFNDINSALITFSTGLNSGTLTAQAIALVNSLGTITTEISSLLED